VSAVLVQMWAGAGPVPVQMWAGAGPVPVQMWAGAGPVPAQMWRGVSPVLGSDVGAVRTLRTHAAAAATLDSALPFCAVASGARGYLRGTWHRSGRRGGGGVRYVAWVQPT
jgi:hypothetical protein